MTDVASTSLAEYLRLKREYPSLFANPVTGGIQIVEKPFDMEAAEQAGAEHLSAKGLASQWARLGLLYENEVFRVVRDPVRFPNGRLGIYFRILMKEQVMPGSVILAVYQGRVILLEQFRHATRRQHLEIPRGFGTADITAADNARKEIAEEVEGEISRLVSMGPMHVNTGLSNEYAELFFAELNQIGKGQIEEGIEGIRLVELDDLEGLIRDSEITDAFTIGAFCRARLKGLL
uniref:ADP-ribose pyrophosphatase n=1 Tax=Candidatus Kentrum sp. TC TaxID=2126339 RepID=A0A450ZD11_9GAMM|nr:MAG: ADP-ribose pyrophosphatase [Candidatus Kentron sp. TC]